MLDPMNDTRNDRANQRDQDPLGLGMNSFLDVVDPNERDREREAVSFVCRWY